MNTSQSPQNGAVIPGARRPAAAEPEPLGLNPLKTGQLFRAAKYSFPLELAGEVSIPSKRGSYSGVEIHCEGPCPTAEVSIPSKRGSYSGPRSHACRLFRSFRVSIPSKRGSYSGNAHPVLMGTRTFTVSIPSKRGSYSGNNASYFFCIVGVSCLNPLKTGQLFRVLRGRGFGTPRRTVSIPSKRGSYSGTHEKSIFIIQPTLSQSPQNGAVIPGL